MPRGPRPPTHTAHAHASPTHASPVYVGAALVAELGEITGRTSIPHIWIGGESIGGFNDGTPGLRPLIASGGLRPALERAADARRAAAAH